MDLAELKLENWNMVLSINIICLISIILIIIFIIAIKFYYTKKNRSLPIKLKEMTLHVFGQDYNIEFDYIDREIAFKSWVEMNTRKIGLEIDLENDVIVEVYNSWYSFFGVIRENMKNVPGHKIDSSSKLIDTLTEILNGSLRNHLTKWQAKFRRWYACEIEKKGNESIAPQIIQKRFPEYDALTNDLLETNQKMIDLKGELKRLAFYKDNKNS